MWNIKVQPLRLNQYNSPACVFFKQSAEMINDASFERNLSH